MPYFFAHIRRAISSNLFALAVILTGFVLPGVAYADTGKRVALVIGNGDYKTAIKLDNPVYDAKAVADSLRKLGFEVIEGYDQDVNEMRLTVGAFSAALP